MEAIKNEINIAGFARSTGHEKHLDEHIDLNRLLHTVEGKMPSQVGGREPIGLKRLTVLPAYR